MNVKRIRPGVYRMETTVDEELELHEIANSQQETTEEAIVHCIDIGVNSFAITEDEGD